MQSQFWVTQALNKWLTETKVSKQQNIDGNDVEFSKHQMHPAIALNLTLVVCSSGNCPPDAQKLKCTLRCFGYHGRGLFNVAHYQQPLNYATIRFRKAIIQRQNRERYYMEWMMDSIPEKKGIASFFVVM